MTFSEPLLEKTKRMLARCDLTQREIARRAGVGLPWLKKFSRTAKDVDASVILTQRLHDFLDLYEQAKSNNGGESRGDQQAPAA